MTIEARKIIGLSVAALDTQSKIGEISQILIDPNNGNLVGFIVVTGGILSPKKVLSITDVRDWDPNGIVTSSIDNLVDSKEIIRIKEILDKKIFLLGMRAKIESGKNLGVVEDFLIDTENQSVIKYYLKDLLGNSRIFLSNKVVKIDHQIIFADDTTEVPTNAAGVPA